MLRFGSLRRNPLNTGFYLCDYCHEPIEDAVLLYTEDDTKFLSSERFSYYHQGHTPYDIDSLYHQIRNRWLKSGSPF